MRVSHTSGGNVKIVDLPLDLHLIILRLLAVIDILNYRSTCKHICDLSRDRGLWIYQLKRQCLQNDIPLETYEFDSMSQETLEAAALMPFHAEVALASENPEALLNGRKAALGPWSYEGHGEQIEGVEIIPGGRFLVTGSTSGSLKCWDLWDWDRTSLRMDPLFKIMLPDHIVMMRMQRSFESSSIMNLVLRAFPKADHNNPKDSTDTTNYLLIVELSLQTKRFELIRRAKLPETTRGFWFDGDLVTVIEHSLNVFIWNWRRELWRFIPTELEAADNDWHSGLRQMILTHSYLLLFTSSEEEEGDVLMSVIKHGACATGADAPQMFRSLNEAEQNPFAEGYIYTDQTAHYFEYYTTAFQTNWRPSSLFPTTYEEDEFSTRAIVDCILIADSESTQLREFTHEEKQFLIGKANDLSKEDCPLVIAHDTTPGSLDKYPPFSSLQIYPGITSEHICSLHNFETLMIIQKRYDGKETYATTTTRRLGKIDHEYVRLVLSTLSGEAFVVRSHSEKGTVIEVWRFVSDGASLSLSQRHALTPLSSSYNTP